MTPLYAAALSVLADVAPEPQTINAAGWIFMLGSVGTVTLLVVWCFKRVLSRRD